METAYISARVPKRAPFVVFRLGIGGFARFTKRPHNFSPKKILKGRSREVDSICHCPDATVCSWGFYGFLIISRKCRLQEMIIPRISSSRDRWFWNRIDVCERTLLYEKGMKGRGEAVKIYSQAARPEESFVRETVARRDQ